MIKQATDDTLVSFFEPGESLKSKDGKRLLVAVIDSASLSHVQYVLRDTSMPLGRLRTKILAVSQAEALKALEIPFHSVVSVFKPVEVKVSAAPTSIEKPATSNLQPTATSVAKAAEASKLANNVDKPKSATVSAPVVSVKVDEVPTVTPATKKPKKVPANAVAKPASLPGECLVYSDKVPASALAMAAALNRSGLNRTQVANA